jgi:hypothetical protein
MNRRPLILAIMAGAVLALGAAVLGRLIDPGFLSNLLAEVAGIGISICVGVLLVDKLIAADRRQQWNKVRTYTLGAIAAHLCDMGMEVCISFQDRAHGAMDKILSGRDSPHAETPLGFRVLAHGLRENQGAPGPDESPSDRTVGLYDHVKWDLDQIQAILIPRVIQSQGEQELVDALIEFDQARRSLHNAIISHKLLVTGSAYPALIDLVEASGRLYQTICGHWTERERTAGSATIPGH